MAFLSKHIIDMGFSATQSALIFSAYGLAAAFSAWSSGVVAEIITPQRAMKIGLIIWVVMHSLFIYFGLQYKSYIAMIIFYGIRGLAYPLFIYSFVMLIVQNVPAGKVSSATGWFWAMYSVGIGVLGSYVPSLTIPWFGETGTLWFALPWVITGGFIAIFSLKNVPADISKMNMSFNEKVKEASRAVTIIFTNKDIFLSSYIRIVNTIAVFGFAIIMPIYFVDELSFTISEWLRIWSVFFFVTIFFNVFWGVVGNYLGWMKQVRWFGCLGMCISCLLFYYLPLHFGNGFYMALIPAILLGFSVCAFVPMTAVFPALLPEHKGQQYQFIILVQA
ncbi:Alpha-ketoglutarate permease [Serratia ficaria]|nr:Alpha-ketoglutarate permease [Serratia ficaria]CAI1965950.1 Alpha-ketoglutarate permease [Serratia ficaria]